MAKLAEILLRKAEAQFLRELITDRVRVSQPLAFDNLYVEKIARWFCECRQMEFHITPLMGMNKQ
jgi:hypothetical protein